MKTGTAPSPFAVRALIEGFYGVYFTHPERLSLLRFLGNHGYNLYIYAPKNDRQHRSRWREQYPKRQMEQFSEAIGCAADSGIDFCYALSPGVDISYASKTDFEAITRKLTAFYDLGVRTFSLLLDDIRREFPDPADAERYSTFAQAQADLSNRLYDWLKRLNPANRLSMCPTDYYGVEPFSPALHELGERLHPDIDVFYTGLDVCAPTIARADVEAFAAVLGRRPLIWDNYPVNDLAMHGELHIGPVRGRTADLSEVTLGIAVNPMVQAEASKIVLATYGDYLNDPGGYDPQSSWERALHESVGNDWPALRLVGENSLRSCLGTPEAERLESLSAAALAALRSGLPGRGPAEALHHYLRELDEACYALRYRIDNLELRNELLPWLEQLERWSWLGRWSLEALGHHPARVERNAIQCTGTEANGIDGNGGKGNGGEGNGGEGNCVEPALLRRIEEYIGLVDAHPKRIGGTFLRPLAVLALERAQLGEPV